MEKIEAPGARIANLNPTKFNWVAGFLNHQRYWGLRHFPLFHHIADLKPDQAVEIFFEHMDVPQMICFILKLFGKVIHPNLNPCLESGKNYLDKHILNLGIHPKFPKFVPVTTRLRLRGGFDVSDLQEHVAPPRPAPPRAAEASGWLW